MWKQLVDAQDFPKTVPAPHARLKSGVIQALLQPSLVKQVPSVIGHDNPWDGVEAPSRSRVTNHLHVMQSGFMYNWVSGVADMAFVHNPHSFRYHVGDPAD